MFEVKDRISGFEIKGIESADKGQSGKVKRFWPVGEFISLWDMINSFNIVAIMAGLDLIKDSARVFSEDNEPLSAKRKKHTLELLDKIDEHFGDFDLGEIESNKNIIRDLVDTNQGQNEIAEEFEKLRTIIEHELKSNICFVMDRRSFNFLMDSNLSLEAKLKFPEASLHFTHAMACYSVSQYPASLFHSMRAAGEILPVIAPHYLTAHGITYTKDLHENWGQVITHLEPRVKQLEKLAKTDPTKKDDFRNMAATLDKMYSIKTAWRDSIMHTLNQVEPDVAKDSILSTRSLIEHLTKELP